ncbi:MAG: hypothetical protein C0501_27185 [Isosphaera sp.]|nr:hypothetical protein [Isosphaera sp.]
MPRLLHVMNFAPRGTRTIDHFILALAREMGGRGWEVRYAFSADPPPDFREALAGAGAGYVVVPFPFAKASARELVRKLGGYRPDVTQASFVSAFTRALLGLKLRGHTRRLVVIDHSSGDAPARRGWRGWAARARGYLVGRVVDAVVPVSAAVARRDTERVFLPARKVRVVYNGIRLSDFPNPPRAPGGVARVVFAGQLRPEKGVMTLLRAHDRLRKAGVTGYELLVAGTGPQEEELKSFCKAAGRDDVRFLGHVDSVPGLFGSADVVVCPSEWYEAFGLVAAEAMACGAACLASDAGGLPEVVGGAGRVFRAGDVGDLAAGLKWLLDDPDARRRLGAAGRARVEELFTLDRMVAGHAAVCEAVHRGDPVAGAGGGGDNPGGG